MIYNAILELSLDIIRSFCNFPIFSQKSGLVM